MRRPVKRLFCTVWVVIFVLGAYILYSGVRNIPKGTFEDVQQRMRLEVTSAVMHAGMQIVAPQVCYYLTDQENWQQRMVQALFLYGEMHPLSYLMAEEMDAMGEKQQSLSAYEAFCMEAADENQVNEKGEVINSQESMEQAKGLISGQIQQQMEENTPQTPPASEDKDQTAQLTKAAANTDSNGILTDQEVKGTAYTADMLSYDFLLNYFYTVDSTTSVTKEQIDAGTLLKKDMTIKGDNSSPQILIYHTHSQEGFVDSVEGDSSTTVVGVGDYLTSLLSEKYGFCVLHDTTTYDIVNGQLDRNKAYSMACANVTKILKENPSIEVVIDLHRDGVEGTRLVSEVNGKQTAQIMFFNGLSYTNKNGSITYLKNPNIEDNLAFSLQLQIEAAKYYPGFTRKIYLKGYRYNLHLCPKALLIEAGAQNNTLEEEKNAMEPLADVLARVLKGESQ